MHDFQPVILDTVFIFSVLFESIKVETLLYLHYENMSMYYTVTFHGCKNDNFQLKN